MSAFEILTKWVAATNAREVVSAKSNGEADSTLSELIINVGGRCVSDFVDERKTVSHLQIPSYYLAEWVAENWWPLLWEPRKSETESDDPSFLSRHSLLAAQHGFALPKVLIVPFGKSVQVSASARDANLADVRFRNSGLATIDRSNVEIELRKFVEAVVARLAESRIEDTPLQDAWTMLTETSEEEIQFCRFAGALGLSPYEIDDGTAALIERLLPSLGERQLMDLCLVSSSQDFPSVAKVAQQAASLTAGAETSTLVPLNSAPVPADNASIPAYRRGVHAAIMVRKRLGISDTDPKGASRVFEALHVDTGFRGQAIKNDDELSITGAVVKDSSEMKVALLQSTEIKRRFAAARAIFSAWSSEYESESRLLTSAVTRDQQANRAFAAELTAPKAFIRSKSAKGSRLTQSALFDIADDLQISPDVVAKQATNNGIVVSPF
jgi:hypothetical protein